MSGDVDCGLPLEPVFRRYPWLAVVFVIGVYVLGAYLDGGM